MASGRRIIFHVDINAFYVSVEQKRNPSIKGLPVVVGALPNEDERGVVITCSYEARKFGLRSGMPISKAHKLCPQAIYLRPDFPLYSKVSARVMDLLKTFAGPTIEQSGIDEAFLDVTAKARDLDDAKRLALEIKDKLLNSEGFTCSIGIGPNKSSAKIASDFQKPDGLTIVPSEGVRQFLAPLSVSVIPGVGKKTKTFLEEHNVITISDLQKIDGKELVKWFGKGGVWLWGVAQGTEELPVIPREMPRSLSVERTLDQDIEDFQIARGVARELAVELIRRVKLGNLNFRTAGIRIRFRGFDTHTREKTLIDYTDDLQVLLHQIELLLEEFQRDGRAIRLVGVRVSDLIKVEPDLTHSSLDNWSDPHS